MEHSKEINEIASALAKAQGKMGSAHKGADNPFYKSKYADLGEVVKAIKEAFAENGLSYTQHPTILDNGDVSVTTFLLHTSGQYFSSSISMPPKKKGDAHAIASAITYARRYALQSVAGIPAEDDDGNMAVTEPEKRKPNGYNRYTPPPPTPEEIPDEPPVMQEVPDWANEQEVNDMVAMAKKIFGDDAKVKVFDYVKKSFDMDGLRGILKDQVNQTKEWIYTHVDTVQGDMEQGGREDGENDHDGQSEEGNGSEERRSSQEVS